MTLLDPTWQHSTAMRMVNRQRNELTRQGRPFTDRSLAEFAAKQVGARPETVLKWMEGE